MYLNLAKLVELLQSLIFGKSHRGANIDEVLLNTTRLWKKSRRFSSSKLGSLRYPLRPFNLYCMQCGCVAIITMSFLVVFDNLVQESMSIDFSSTKFMRYSASLYA